MLDILNCEADVIAVLGTGQGLACSSLVEVGNDGERSYQDGLRTWLMQEKKSTLL